jgi:putative transposase
VEPVVHGNQNYHHLRVICGDPRKLHPRLLRMSRPLGQFVLQRGSGFHLAKQGINTHYIKPGSPWEQPYVESFHDKLRDELLNREIFYSLEEAKNVLSSWNDEYNAERPHSSLNYQTPNEYAEAYAKPPRATRPRPQQADVSLTTAAIPIRPRTNTMTLV